MQKITYIVLLFFISIHLSAQSSLNSLFYNYENTKGVTVIEIKKEMFDMLEDIDFSNQNNTSGFNTIMKDLDNIKIITFTNTKASKAIIYKFNQVILSNKYKKLISVSTSQQKVKMLAYDNGNYISEFIIITDNSFILMEGKLQFSDLKKMINYH